MEREILAKQIGRKLMTAREEAGLSRAEVGQRLGLTERGYGHIEAGRSLIGLDHLLQLPHILGKPITAFLPASVVASSERDNPLLDPNLQFIIEHWQRIPPPVQQQIHNLIQVYLGVLEQKTRGEPLE